MFRVTDYRSSCLVGGDRNCWSCFLVWVIITRVFLSILGETEIEISCLVWGDETRCQGYCFGVTHSLSVTGDTDCLFLGLGPIYWNNNSV